MKHLPLHLLLLFSALLFVAACQKDGSSASGGSSSKTANCYIVSAPGTYSFQTVKGNSNESVGNVASAVVLWESFGTSSTISKGSIIQNVSYESSTITYSTPSTLKNGNAVIAAKDASGNILWSWHIWVCKDYDPVATAQTYYNNAGVMMDRNLGATSAKPGDVGALGLLYQWGRKDPFLGSSSISSDTQAKSTISWPSPVESDATNGTIDFAVSHPTTFITSNTNNYDWYYSKTVHYTDNTRWQAGKTIYDPCPLGWKVPTGGNSGIWATACGDDEFYCAWDFANKGVNFSDKFGSASTIWYPASGKLYGDGSLGRSGKASVWWSCTPYYYFAYYLGLFYNEGTDADILLGHDYHATGYSVRCMKE